MKRHLIKLGLFTPWEASKILKKNTLLMGRVIAHNVEMEAKCRVTRNMFDENLNAFFRHFTDVFVHDPVKMCKVGDLILIRKMKERMSLDIGHEVVKVLYPYGDITDPISGKKVIRDKYRDDLDVVHGMLGKAPDSGKGFVYNDAPPRGWQEGKKDFTHMPGYYKYHQFPEGHPLHNDPAASLP